MNQIVSSQTILFLTSVEIGILMGVLFDLVRIFRKLIKHPNFLVQIEDMLYWVICGFVSFYMLYICNYAEIRPYIFIGIILGGIFYFCTFSIVFMKIATIIINYIKKVINRIIGWMLIPIKGMIHLVSIPLNYLKRKFVHIKYLNKVRYRQFKRKQYEHKSDQKVERYLKKGRT